MANSNPTTRRWLTDSPLIADLFACGLSRLVETARKHGPVNPVGDGDSKTASPSTYRPVGSTCPDGSSEHIGRCPYLGHGCYAEGGNVNLHQTRAGADLDASVNAAAVAMVWAVRTGRIARLHVSGDFVRAGRVDHRYIAQLGILADTVNVTAGRPIGTAIAWSYTHIPADVFEGYRVVLARHGIHVRLSDHAGAHGAIVRDFRGLQGAGVRYLKCPAQLPQGSTCAECRACWERPDHTIVFEPHGAAKNRARAVALRVLGGAS